MRRLFVTRPTAASDAKSRYLHEFRPSGRIVSEPAVGDLIVDVLDVFPENGGKYGVWSNATKGAITLSSAWDWGDQYEDGAEYQLAQECLSVLFGKDTLLNLEAGPLFPLVYPAN